MDAALQIVREKPTILAASGRFGGFGPEAEHKVTTVKVESNPVLEGMKKVWATCGDGRLNYGDIIEVLNKIKIPRYSAKDIETVSLVIAEFQDEVKFSDKAGLLLSALINNCEENVFVIHTAHLTKKINDLGHRNTKDITVAGDAGDYVGDEMKGGMITVMGNSGSKAGYDMRGGAITVMGDAEGAGRFMKGGSITVEMICSGDIGFTMSGGVIVVKGFADNTIGERMVGGEIHIHGNRPIISEDFVSGKIFHKEELMVDK